MQIPGEWPRDHQRRTAGPFERDRFWHQFSENDVQHGEQYKRQRQCRAVRENRCSRGRQPAEHGAKQLSERGFAERAKSQAGERDPDLHAGNHPVELAQQILHHLGAAVALLDQLADARNPHGDQRKLSRGKEPIDGHQRQHGQQSQPNHGPILSVRVMGSGNPAPVVFHHTSKPPPTSRATRSVRVPYRGAVPGRCIRRAVRLVCRGSPLCPFSAVH